MSPSLTTLCPRCGEALSADVIFCEHCFTMNPMVRDFLENNPKQHPKDYLTVDSTCPLCGKKQHRRVIDEYLLIKLRTPIRRCKKCGGYFTQVNGLEWCVAPKESKRKSRLLTELLIRNELNILEAMIDTPLAYGVTALLYLLLHYPIGFLWLSFTLPKAIRDSDLRLAHNPDYPQILANMGYSSYMDEKYNILFDSPPKKQSFKDFLKEAFTFE